ncbi:MAG: exonuclease SbcCD subunit D [Phycisphaerae bacterium]
MRLVQISDLHLGRSLGGLDLPSGVRDSLERAALNALDRACQLVLERDAAVLLIPGDLFDRPEVSEELVSEVQALFECLQRPVLVSPGNHDAFGPMSVWNNAALERLGLRRWSDNVWVFSSRGLTPRSVIDGELVVYGHRVEGYHAASDSPLTDVVLTNDARYRVLLVHGALQGTRQDRRTTLPFTAPQLAELGADYAAVGHYHRYLPIEYEGRLVGAYAGAAVPGEMDEDPHGGLLVVTLRAEGSQVEFVNVHPGRIARLAVAGEPPFTGTDDACVRALAAARRSGLTGEDIVSVRLTGCSSLPLDAGSIAERLSPHFRHVALSDETDPEATLPTVSGGERATVESSYVRLLRGEIECCGDADRRELLESALRYGRLALRGRSLRPPAAVSEPEATQEHDVD